jgi:hypothetical protein
MAITNTTDTKKENEVLKASRQAALKSVLPNTRVAAKPEYIKAPGEVVYSSEANNVIILGNSPTNSPDMIKALNGATITLAVGLGTAIKSKQVPTTSKVTLSPEYYYDSAVISISEQTNVDSNFGYMSEGKSVDASAIALKADVIRLFSRGNVKIVTGIDQKEKPIQDPDAPEHPRRDYSGISLVANMDEGSIQPMVKGEYLVEFLSKIILELEKLYGIVNKFAVQQNKINDVLKIHTHLCNFTGTPLVRETDPALSVVKILQQEIEKVAVNDTFTTKIPNIQNLKTNYLTDSGTKCIKSSFNKTN